MKLPQNLEITLNYFNIPNKQFDIDKVINVYTYGSHVYETATEQSDIDYIIVYEQENDISDTLVSKIGNNVLNATLMSPTFFQKRLDEHSIDVLECYFLREDYKFERVKFNFNLNLDKLRRSISAVCSNSWVKCKKKIAQGDDYIGKKSTFHSLRIADYGIQIAKEGKIISYTNPYSNILKYDNYLDLLNEIMSLSTWNEIKEKYQVVANNIRSEFREVAPLNEIKDEK
jgi:predicted nucleotidyltransferase